MNRNLKETAGVQAVDHELHGLPFHRCEIILVQLIQQKGFDFLRVFGRDVKTPVFRNGIGRGGR